MFVFMTAIRHPANANDFSKVERLLTLTLKSICGQTNSNFKVVVVCNKLPNIEFKDHRIFYHVVDFPPPSQDKGSAVQAAPRFKDKGTKYMAGMLYAKRFNPKYLYIIDSDDWVNKKLVETMEKSENYPVWHVDKGYIVNFPAKEYKRISGLSRYCGSTFVYDYKYLMEHADIKNDIHENSTQDELISGTSEFFICKLMCNHTINYKHFKSVGFEPKTIELRTACWIQGTGENVSGTKGGSSGIPIGKEFINTFSLPETVLSTKKPNLFLQIRDILVGWQSSYTWYKTKKTGVGHF